MSDRVQDLFDRKIKKVVRAYENEVPENIIAEEIGVSPPTVSKWLTKEGYKRKGGGRIPLAMKARVRDLHLRDWDAAEISNLLKLGITQVKELSKPKQNPILSGKDPLKVKGQKKKKKKGKKKKKPKLEPGEKWPPEKHKCSKHWTENEKAYVLQLITKKVAPLAVYKRMRASKKRQRRIWTESGGKGDPPNFPPPKGPFVVPGEPGAPAVAPTKAQERARKLAATGAEKIALLEAEALERTKRIAELEKLKKIEEKHIKDLSVAQKKLSRAAREQLAVTESALAAVKKRKGLKPPKKVKPKRVLKDSYEAEVLGLPVGSLAEPKKLGRPPSKKTIKEWADNGRYFVVSKDWTDLKNAKPDELKLFAAYMNSKRFPMRVERRGDQPKAFYQSLWPKKIEKRWETTVSSGLTLVDKYRNKKTVLRKKKMFSERIAIYLSAVYDGYRNKKLNAAQRKEARELVADHWARLSKLERLVMIYDMKLADDDGKPTTLGVDRSLAAKMLLEKASKRAARKLTERRISSKKMAIREAGEPLALPAAEPEPEDEEGEIARLIAETQLALDEPDEDE